MKETCHCLACVYVYAHTLAALTLYQPMTANADIFHKPLRIYMN